MSGKLASNNAIMNQEWEFIKEHRNVIVTFIVSCLIYMVVYIGYIDRSSLRFDEVWVSNHDTIFLAAGRWGGYLFRVFLGHGPCYPVAGIMGGLLLNLAILIQLRLLGVQRLWQMLAFAILYLSSVGWCDNLQYSTMSDFFAASVLLTSFSVYYLRQSGRKNVVVAVLCLTLAFGCFQSSALCFLAIVMLVFLREMMNGDNKAMADLLRRGAIAGGIALCVYYGCSVIARQFAPQEIQEIAKSYQYGLIGWRKVHHLAAPEACEYVWEHGIKAPLSCMFGLSADMGQWLYATVWFPAFLLVLRTARLHGTRRASLIAVACLVLIYIPFTFSAALLAYDKGVKPYMCMAQPIVLAGLWYLGLQANEVFCRRYRNFLLVFLIGAFVKNAYAANVDARNNRYFYDLACHEMRNMHLRATIEAQNASLSNSPYLVCGRVPMPNCTLKMDGDNLPEQVLPAFFWSGIRIDMQASFLRLSKLRAATKEEQTAHAQTLSQMPIWPAVGSVKADGDVVLIKINALEEPKP